VLSRIYASGNESGVSLQLSNVVGGLPSRFGPTLDGTDGRSATSKSSTGVQLQSNCQAARRTEPPRTTPSCSVA